MEASFWERTAFTNAPAVHLKSNATAPSQQDVIIVGAGFQGAWCALELKKAFPQLRIVLIERGGIPQGASTRNAGFACFGSPTELLHDASLMSEEKMLEIVADRYEGIRRIRETVPDAESGFDPCGGYECLDGSGKHVLGKLDRLNGLLQAVTGMRETFTLADDRMARLGLTGFAHLVNNPLEASLHPAQLLLALHQRVREQGVQIRQNSEVTGFLDRNNRVEVTTNDASLSASLLLVCTNGSLAGLLPDCEVEPARGQMILTGPIPGLKLRGTFHYDEGYYYFRNVGDRVLLGGARNSARDQERTNEPGPNAAIRETLRNFLQTHILRGIDHRIEQSWSGIMGFTQDKLPLIHRVGDRVIGVTSCNGMGVALSPVTARKVAELAKAWF